MGCIYSNYDGKCQMWSEEIEWPGCDEEGYCVCDEDPCPRRTCESFETDGTDCDGDCDNCPEIE